MYSNKDNERGEIMRNLKDFIHTKNDIYGLKTKWPGEVIKYLKSEHKKAVKWVQKAELNKKSDGIEDENHKIEKRGDKYVQLEKELNLNADIYKKIGFSEPELLNLIKKIELNII